MSLVTSHYSEGVFACHPLTSSVFETPRKLLRLSVQIEPRQRKIALIDHVQQKSDVGPDDAVINASQIEFGIG